ncbi:MAG TPA: hypothetical protein VN634_02525 [Candidatus Limnocylindrales bacterium]|nr:hypothetical protein [Candidatus Limnocylindrales bacterium]
MATSTAAGEGNLSNVIAAFDEQGFTEHFAVRGKELVGLESGAHFDASEVIIRRVERFEGASDPDDMSIVYAIETRSGVRGTLTDAFGVYSSPAVSDFVSRVESRVENPQSDANARMEPLRGSEAAREKPAPE